MIHLALGWLTPPPDGGAPTGFFAIQIALFVAIIYFLIFRPNQQARKKHEQLLQDLKKGDEITTSGGLIGRVKDLRDDKELGVVRVTIETGTSTVVVDRSRIVRVGNTVAPGGGA